MDTAPDEGFRDGMGETELSSGSASSSSPTRVVLRDNALVVNECVVCPRTLDLSDIKPLPKKVGIPGTRPMYCCSVECLKILMSPTRKKCQLAEARYEDWATTELGATLRIGDSVVLLQCETRAPIGLLNLAQASSSKFASTSSFKKRRLWCGIILGEPTL
jgi:hypothetical protein